MMLSRIYTAALLAGVAFGAAAAPPSLEVALTPPEGPYHRTAVYTVTVEADTTAQYEFPDLVAAEEGIEITQGEITAESIGENRMRRTRRYVLDPLSPGLYRLPPFDLGWRDGEEEGALTAPALAYHARELTEAEMEAVAQFSGITPPEALLPEPRFSWWLLVVGNLAALAAAVALFLLWRRRRGLAESAAPALPAWKTALNRLRELQQRNLPETGKLDAYYVDLSAILRYYIEDRFHIQAPEQTTPEFIEAASTCGVFSETQQVFLSGFLRQCDRIKFARLQPGLEDAREHFKQVRLFVKETIPEEARQSLEQAA